MFNKKIINLSICIVLLSAIFSGCIGQQAGEAKVEVPLRNELVLAIRGEPRAGFDPTTGWGRTGSPLFHSTLLTRDNDLNIVNDLATSYKISEDGLTWTVTIRDDVVFSDGYPLTSADVVYTFDTTAKRGGVIDLTFIESVKAIDNQTVVFTLYRPRSTFKNLLTTLGIVPKHAHGDNYAENPIGSGPYKFVQWDRGEQLIVEANPKWYGPAPFFERLTFLFLGEEAAFAAAKAGQVDVVVIPQALAKQEVSGMRLLAVDSVDNRGIMFPMQKSGQKDEEGYPIGNDVTADIAIRKAINVAINREALVNGVLEGFGAPAYTVADNLPWWNPETVIKDNDSLEAKRILADGGWTDVNGDGVLEKGTLEARFTLIYPAGDMTRMALALAVADMVRPVGIEIKVEGKSWDAIKTMMHSNAVLFGWGSHCPMEMYNLHSNRTAGVGWWNTGFYSNPVVDNYMERALAATCDDEAIAYWKKAQWDGSTGLSARGDAPWAWLVNLDHCFFVRDDLDIGRQRVQPHGHGWPITANIVEWRIIQ